MPNCGIPAGTPESLCQYVRVMESACVVEVTATERRNYGREETLLQSRRACAQNPDGCNSTRQRRLVTTQRQNLCTQAQTDDKQFPAGQIKRAFGKNAKKCKNRITNTLLVALGFPKSIENIGASAQVVSFLAIFKIVQVDISDPLTCQRMRRKRWRWRRRRRMTLTLNP